MTIDLVGLLKEQASGPLLEKTAALLGENVDAVEKGILVSSAELLSSMQDKFSKQQGEDIFKSFGDGSKLDKLPQHLAGGNQTVNYLSQGLDKSRELFGSNADSTMQRIADISGLKAFSVGSLLGIVNPMLLGLLGKQKANGLDIAGFTSLFESHASAIAELAKPSIKELTVDEEQDETLSPIDRSAELKVAKDITKTGNFGFLKILIPLILLSVAGFFFKDTILEFANSRSNTSSNARPESIIVDESAQEQSLAEGFVKLALGIGQHDKDFVDAYHGPDEWKVAADTEKRSIKELETEANTLLSYLDNLSNKDSARFRLLRKQLIAAQTRLAMVQGKTFTFDEETKLLYDAVAPQYDLAIFDDAVNTIEKLLPGEGEISERLEKFNQQFHIPEAKLSIVFNAAIAECKRRTLEHYDLPEDENFEIEFVTNKPWSGYNWYKGHYFSLIQVNTDFPISIGRAIDLGCHEGYPGHHTWNVLLERDVLKEKGWIEYSVYPLFSPLSITAEGSANYGIDLAFPGDEKKTFEREVLYPLAGINPELANIHEDIKTASKKLSHARNHIAREYLDGRITKDKAIELSMKYSLQTKERATSGMSFIENYRGYVINYNLGKDIVSDYIDKQTAKGTDSWDAFEYLLRTPTSASELQESK